MSLYVLTGDDSLIIDGFPLSNFFAGTDYVTIDLPNDSASLDTSKDGNSVWSDNQEGNNGDLTMKLMAGSGGDIFCNGLVVNQKQDFVASGLREGIFKKRLGDENGNVKYDTYTLEGGKMINYSGGIGDAKGNTEQGMKTYVIRFAKIDRAVL